MTTFRCQGRGPSPAGTGSDPTGSTGPSVSTGVPGAEARRNACRRRAAGRGTPGTVPTVPSGSSPAGTTTRLQDHHLGVPDPDFAGEVDGDAELVRAAAEGEVLAHDRVPRRHLAERARTDRLKHGPVDEDTAGADRV